MSGGMFMSRKNSSVHIKYICEEEEEKLLGAKNSFMPCALYSCC